MRHASLVRVGLLLALGAAAGCTKESRRASDEPPAPGSAAPAVRPPNPPAADAAVVAPGDAMPSPALAVELTVDPVELTTANRKDLMVTVTVRNLGPAVIDPELNLSTLMVDGVPSKDWNMALANSGRPKQWKALPPGDSVSGSVARLADALFPRPGDYTLLLRVSGVESAPVAVRVKR